MTDHVPGNEARHQLRLLRIDHANHLDAGPQAGTHQNVVDAGADRTDGLQVRIAFEGIVRRMPGDRQTNICARSAGGMVHHLDPIGDAGEFRTEKLAKVEAAADEDATHRSRCLGR